MIDKPFDQHRERIGLGCAKTLIDEVCDAGGGQTEIMNTLEVVITSIVGSLFQPEQYQDVHYQLQSHLRDRLILLAEAIHNGEVPRPGDIERMH
jgi:hypothetical protein